MRSGRTTPFAARSSLTAVLVLLLMATSAMAAVEQPFVPRFTANDRGEIQISGNTLMTCPAVADCANAQQGLGPGSLNNNGWNMTRVDVDADASTFSSSTATLSLPPGATVRFAGLYYGSRTSAGAGGAGAPNPPARGAVRLRAPGAPGYTTITAAVADSAAVAGAYVAFADVTAAVAAAGPGQYTVADVQSGTGVDRFAGWALVVVYRDPAQPPRNLTVFDGLASIESSDPPLSIPVGGFVTPLTGAVRSTVGVVAYEGDRASSGDRLLLNGVSLGDASNPPTNVFNSSIAQRGAPLAGGNPAYLNQLGFDADLIAADGILPNGATSTTLQESTSFEQYLTQVLTLSTELYPLADLRVDTDVSPDPPREGQPATFTTIVRNDGPDAAPGVVLTQDVRGPADLISATPSQGTCTVGDTIRCELGAIPAGASASVRVRVRPETRGALESQVSVTAPVSDPTPVDELPVLSTRVREGRGRLRLRKIAGAGRARPGQVVGYRIALRSAGRAPARRIRVCDRPPAGLVLISARGTRVRDGRACWRIPALRPGASRVLRVNARVAASSGALANRATVSARNAGRRAAAAALRVAPLRQGACAASAVRAC